MGVKNGNSRGWGGGVKGEKPSVGWGGGGVWIFSGSTQCE